MISLLTVKPFHVKSFFLCIEIIRYLVISSCILGYLSDVLRKKQKMILFRCPLIKKYSVNSVTLMILKALMTLLILFSELGNTHDSESTQQSLSLDSTKGSTEWWMSKLGIAGNVLLKDGHQTIAALPFDVDKPACTSALGINSHVLVGTKPSCVLLNYTDASI
ncbi:hypothetical protein C5167_046640 [Papaver somniferum]|uniref:Uncharacterized protein n=1 Tax=Papaver somniferum TaxID=3469 RepID=A0A4Y7LHV8_PAPSO|nr:hypothetical protein C5167_046640 [Papaver somniferum]